MPNWTTNTIECFARSKEEMNHFLTSVRSDDRDFDFERIVPMPREVMIECGSVTNEAARIALYLQYGLDAKNYPSRYRYWYYRLEKPFDHRDVIRIASVYGVDEDTVVSIIDRCTNAAIRGRDRIKECISASPTEYLNYRSPETLESLIALGFRVLDNIDTYGFPGWYEWANNHWGTKWNACEVTVERYSDLGCNIRFDTAWCAPMPVFYALEKQFPEMELTAWWVDEEDWELQENDPEFMSGEWCSERNGDRRIL